MQLNKSALHFFAPEVVQTSAMDCGPAALKCLLEGFGVHVSYGRLREACQTDVDGTSLDTVEDIALQLGLQVEQVMMPIDHLFLLSTQNLPALVVAKLPMGHPHFLVVWRKHGDWVQVMDPAKGRRWVKQAHFLKDVYRHQIPLEATLWRTWATGEGLLAPLQERLTQFGVSLATTHQLIASATESTGWFDLALLDAATRMVAAVVQAKGVRPGPPATRLLTSLIAQVNDSINSPNLAQTSTNSQQVIPDMFWSVCPLDAPVFATLTDKAKPEKLEMLRFSGAVLVRVLGRQETRPSVTPPVDKNKPSLNSLDDQTEKSSEEATSPPLSLDLLAALQEAPERPAWAVWRSLRADGLLAPTILLMASALATAGVVIEATLLQGLLAFASKAGLQAQPMAFLALYLLFVSLLVLLELPLSVSVVRMGRKVETRLRIALLEKLPQLGDRYFHSRLISDMAQRAYGLRQLRELPGLVLRAYRLAFQLLLTAGGIIWLAPNGATFALLAVGWSVGCSLLAQWLLTEQDNKVRSHAAALTRFTLDGLLGLIPLRTHVAGWALRREQEGVLTQWQIATESLNDLGSWLQLLESLGSYTAVIGIIFTYLASDGEASGVLLLLYWALNLSNLGQSLTIALQQYPAQRNQVLQLLEPLSAPTEEQASTECKVQNVESAAPRNVMIQMRDVSVLAGGHPVLQAINLSIEAGTHVAIVGPSGAGKSSFVGLLLGWYRAASGSVLIDGEPLTSERLITLRQEIAWVDPTVQIWNRSLLENLHHSTAHVDEQAVARVLEEADLYNVLERLPNGLQTELGESGGLISGGEGQRVRLGRAMLRPAVRLAILDEPFRGLDRDKRRQLLKTARAHWRNATLLCITHDVSETKNFDRVLVVEGGRIVEDASPLSLAADTNSHYHALLQAEMSVRQCLWQGAQWRHLRMEEGILYE